MRPKYQTIQQAFRAGWMHGRRYGRHQSMREVLAEHPTLSYELAEAYLNGQDDGIRNDRFRLDYEQATNEEESRKGWRFRPGMKVKFNGKPATVIGLRSKGVRISLPVGGIRTGEFVKVTVSARYLEAA